MLDLRSSIDTAAELLLVLLLAGHIAADFLVQTATVAREKSERGAALLLHGGLTTLTHLVLILPFWSISLGGGVLLLGLAHTALDGLKGRIERIRGSSLRLFFADQLAHVLLVLALWLGLTRMGVASNPWLRLDPSWTPRIAAGVLIAMGLVFNGQGGTVIVRLLLQHFPEVVPRDPEGYNMGRTIGVLERILLFILVLLDQWGALGLVLAAKSIARFKELGHQPFADYYLIGTLTSILVAIGTGVLIRAAVGG